MLHRLYLTMLHNGWQGTHSLHKIILRKGHNSFKKSLKHPANTCMHIFNNKILNSIWAEFPTKIMESKFSGINMHINTFYAKFIHM